MNTTAKAASAARLTRVKHLLHLHELTRLLKRVRLMPPPLLAHVLFFMVACNLPLLVASHICRLVMHGWISLDFLLVGILSLWLPRAATAIILGFALAIDMIVATAETYYMSPQGLLSNSSELWQMSPQRLGAAAFAFVLVLLCSLATFALPKLPRKSDARLRGTGAYALICLVLLATQFGVALAGPGGIQSELHGGFLRDVESQRFLAYVHPIRSRARSVFMSAVNPNQFAASEPRFWKMREHPGAAAVALDSVKNSKRPKPDVVLVLVESWGASKEPLIADSLVAPYGAPEIRSRYRVIHGTVPFWGNTSSGEARELCSAISIQPLLDKGEAALQGCIVDRFRESGFHTIAIHGMSGAMYQRREWYPKLGFQEMWFREEFDAQHLPQCPGLFRGTCDASIAQWIGNRLQVQDQGPRFIYWVTLNSHLPVPNPPVLSHPASCSVSSILKHDVALCSWYQLIAQVHLSVVELALRPPPRPTIFVIVGDHAPPFADPIRRAGFSNSNVPYVVLIPSQCTFPPPGNPISSRLRTGTAIPPTHFRGLEPLRYNSQKRLPVQ